MPAEWSHDEAEWISGQIIGLLPQNYPARISLQTEAGDACPFFATTHFWRVRARPQNDLESRVGGESSGCVDSPRKDSVAANDAPT